MILAFDVTDKQMSISHRLANGATHHKGMEYRKAAEVLLPLIREITDQAGEPITALGVIRGPGSFTGIRVGLSTAMGLKASLGVPVLGFSKFELAARFLGDGHYMIVIPSVRDQLLVAEYWDGKPLSEPHVRTRDHLPENTPCHALGVVEGIASLSLNLTEFCLDLLSEPEADHPPEPLYIRPPDARKSRALLDRLLNPE